MSWDVAAFYRFMSLTDLPSLREEIRALCAAHGVCGTILVAPEGLNGTVAIPAGQGETFMTAFDAITGIRKGEVKFSTAAEKPFNRMKVRLKKEIITLKAPEADPLRRTGIYVSPAEWNDLIHDPDVTILDTRNMYETETGIFTNAIDPQIRHFTHFKDFVSTQMDPSRHKKIAMYCTGGIRCEKASSYMLAHGFETVYQLKGGILKYLEVTPESENLWQGSCFVFDEREEIGLGLKEVK